MSAATRDVLAFAHIGDLHITDAEQPNFIDLMSIVAQIETQAKNQLDFVVLPGDCADHGERAQYALIATALRMLSIPVHAIPGDHDMEQGDLANFYGGLGAASLPASFCLKGCRCLFLDFCGAGRGGPDFRLGEPQFRWLEMQLRESRDAGQTTIVFMHSYPDDLRGDGEAQRLTRLMSHHGVALVDMGHTHYNDLANDGTTIYAATRSTGQREEGPVGYSVTTIDDGIVGWRFKALADPFPFVMITAPADYRLLRGQPQAGTGRGELRARIFGPEPIAKVEFQIDDGAWSPLVQIGEGPDWRASFEGQASRFFDLTVRAFNAEGRPGIHTIRAAGTSYEPLRREASGSDAAAVGAWLENGILGTQLGPNRHGRKW